MKNVVSLERARELFSYDPQSGLLTRKIPGPFTARIGSVAGSLDKRGYLRVSVDGKSVKVHRLVWLLATGEWPSVCIDHINGQKGDNRLSNLRLATVAENCRNRKVSRNNKSSGVLGVSWHAASRKWQAQITHQKKNHNLGVFDSIEQAAKARECAAERLHGMFAGHLGQGGAR
jgi:hypothetical protein